MKDRKGCHFCEFAGTPPARHDFAANGAFDAEVLRHGRLCGTGSFPLESNRRKASVYRSQAARGAGTRIVREKLRAILRTRVHLSAIDGHTAVVPRLPSSARAAACDGGMRAEKFKMDVPRRNACVNEPAIERTHKRWRATQKVLGLERRTNQGSNQCSVHPPHAVVTAVQHAPWGGVSVPDVADKLGTAAAELRHFLAERVRPAIISPMNKVDRGRVAAESQVA